MRIKAFGTLLLLYCFVAINVYGQNNNIYIFEDLYGKSIQDLNSRTLFDLKPIKMLGQYMIDPTRNGEIRYDLIDKYIDKLYPDPTERGILCLNLEGSLFKDLQNNSKNSLAFKNAEYEYIKVIRYIKNKLPFVKVGVYGIPFTVYYNSQLKRNEKNKLDAVLKEVDILMPSLYIFYPALQKGESSNIRYLNKNLDIAFQYGSRLNKPVLPFFWYLIHPSNDKFGLFFIPKDEFHKYLNYINNYTFSKKQVDGVIWWDTKTPYNNKRAKENLFKKRRNINNMDVAFDYYLNKFNSF